MKWSMSSVINGQQFLNKILNKPFSHTQKVLSGVNLISKCFYKNMCCQGLIEAKTDNGILCLGTQIN